MIAGICLVVKLTLKLELFRWLPKKAVDWRMNYRERFGSRLDTTPAARCSDQTQLTQVHTTVKFPKDSFTWTMKQLHM